MSTFTCLTHSHLLKEFVLPECFRRCPPSLRVWPGSSLWTRIPIWENKKIWPLVKYVQLGTLIKIVGIHLWFILNDGLLVSYVWMYLWVVSIYGLWVALVCTYLWFISIYGLYVSMVLCIYGLYLSSDCKKSQIWLYMVGGNLWFVSI